MQLVSYNSQNVEEVVMSPQALRTIRRLEGRHVSVSLCDGSRLDDCELVSAGRGGARTLWLHDGMDDRMVPAADVIDLWETR